MKYRAEIDGLRAMAVIPVILYHAGFEVFSGGFIGVDIFFVISGYLITTIIVSEMDEGKFSIVSFYERRARRILPALYFMVIASFPLFWFLFYGQFFTEYVKSITATATFTSNFFFWKNSDYFSLGSEIKPLLHTWSLAVEEQYYIFFPLFLMVTWRFGMKFILILLSVVFLFSLSMAEWGAYNSPNATFYLLPTRGWELLVGVFIAFYLKNKRSQGSHFLNQILSLIGLSLIVYSVIAFNKDTPTPSVYLLIPTLGTGLLILSAKKRTFVHSLLSSRPLVGIGLVSYSAYLWHQPLLAALAFASPFDSNHACKIFLIALTLIFAVFSYRFIEAPFREKQKVSKQSVFLMSFIGFAVLTSAGVFLSDKNEHNIRLSKKFDKHDYIFDNSKLLNSSWSILGKRLDAFFPTYSVSENEIDNELWFNLDDLRSKVLIVGNSHSKDFYNVLHFSDQAKAKLQLARYGTQIKDISFKFFNSPNYKNADVIMLVSAMTESDIVSMDGILEKMVGDGKKIILFKTIFRAFERSYVTKIDKLIVNNIDHENGPQIINLAYTELYNTNSFYNQAALRASLLEDQVLNTLADKFNLQVLDRMDYVCYPRLCNLVSPSYGKYFFDSGHHTLLGAQIFGDVVDELGWVDNYFLLDEKARFED